MVSLLSNDFWQHGIDRIEPFVCHFEEPRFDADGAGEGRIGSGWNLKYRQIVEMSRADGGTGGFTVAGRATLRDQTPLALSFPGRAGRPAGGRGGWGRGRGGRRRWRWPKGTRFVEDRCR